MGYKVWFLMVHQFSGFLDLLNRYSNILVALATLVYVVLTYRMLRALRRESTRELRLRHLQDIKEKVVQPLHDWINQSAVPALRGGANFLVVTSRPFQRQNVALGEPAYDCKLGLEVSLHPRDAIGGHLFWHTKQSHFPKELDAAEHLLEEIEKLTSDSLSVARQWADEMAKATPLLRGSGTVGTNECADSDFLATVCLTSLIANREPDLRVQVLVHGALEISDSGGRPVARGATDTVRAWYSSAKKIAAEGWQASGLGERVQDLLRETILVSELVSRLNLTYDLRGDCEYIGGRNPGRIKRLWRRLMRR
jgi:hypothetical protein